MPTAESRLDRMIARLLTQRACLAHAAGLIADVPGPVLEVGLGKGRTYSHLRGLFPNREIFAFDKELHAPADSQPDAAHYIDGEFEDTLPGAPVRFGGPAALVHADIGTEKRERDAALAAFVAETLAPQMASGGILMGDREMAAALLDPVPLPAIDLPDGVAAWPYFMYRKASG